MLLQAVIAAAMVSVFCQTSGRQLYGWTASPSEWTRRRMYMEGKEMHKDTNSQLQELEAYLHELSDDLTEMITDASPEEKATLRQKMTMLADKIN